MDWVVDLFILGIARETILSIPNRFNLFLGPTFFRFDPPLHPSISLRVILNLLNGSSVRTMREELEK